MIWTIIIQILFTLIVIGGIFYLKSSKKYDENSRINILIIIGVLLSVSLIISVFKQKRYITFSLLNYHLNQCQQKFTTLPTTFEHKFKSLAQIQVDNSKFYKTNYQNFGKKNIDYQQKIIFISKKYEGATMFLYELAKLINKNSIPVYYIKFTYFLDNQYEIAQEMDIPSIRILQDIVYNWNKKGLVPYIIIDGLQFVSNSLKFLQTLKNVLQKSKVNFIANIQNRNSLQRIFTHLNFYEIVIRQWKPPSKQFMESIIQNIYFKKLPRDFRTLAQLLQSSEQQIILRRNNLNKQMASHFQIKQLMKQLNPYKTNLKMSTLKKIMSLQKIRKLERLGIIYIKQGIVNISPNNFLIGSDL